MNENHFKKMQSFFDESARSYSENFSGEKFVVFDTALRDSCIRDKILRPTFTVWQYNKKTGDYCMSEIRPKSKLSLFISKVKNMWSDSSVG